jgi:Uma2 family endonuclease
VIINKKWPNNFYEQRERLTMIITHQKLTFTEYLNYQDNTDNCYELVEGELILMSLGTGKYGAIAKRSPSFF